MLREFIVNTAEPAVATYKATADIATGTAVVLNHAAGTFGKPSAETAANLMFVDKERYPSGAEAAQTNLSDYATSFNTVKNGECGKLCAYLPGDVFGTSEYDATTITAANKGKRVSAGTDGKITLATGSVASKYVFVDLYSDNGHTLAQIRVADDAVGNTVSED